MNFNLITNSIFKEQYKKIIEILFNERNNISFFDDKYIGWLSIAEIASKSNIQKDNIYGYIVGLHFNGYLQRSFWNLTLEHKYRLSDEYYNLLIKKEEFNI